MSVSDQCPICGGIRFHHHDGTTGREAFTFCPPVVGRIELTCPACQRGAPCPDNDRLHDAMAKDASGMQRLSDLAAAIRSGDATIEQVRAWQKHPDVCSPGELRLRAEDLIDARITDLRAALAKANAERDAAIARAETNLDRAVEMEKQRNAFQSTIRKMEDNLDEFAAAHDRILARVAGDRDSERTRADRYMAAMRALVRAEGVDGVRYSAAIEAIHSIVEEKP